MSNEQDSNNEKITVPAPPDPMRSAITASKDASNEVSIKPLRANPNLENSDIYKELFGDSIKTVTGQTSTPEDKMGIKVVSVSAPKSVDKKTKIEHDLKEEKPEVETLPFDKSRIPNNEEFNKLFGDTIKIDDKEKSDDKEEKEESDEESDSHTENDKVEPVGGIEEMENGKRPENIDDLFENDNSEELEESEEKNSDDINNDADIFSDENDDDDDDDDLIIDDGDFKEDSDPIDNNIGDDDDDDDDDDLIIDDGDFKEDSDPIDNNIGDEISESSKYYEKDVLKDEDIDDEDIEDEDEDEDIDDEDIDDEDYVPYDSSKGDLSNKYDLKSKTTTPDSKKDEDAALKETADKNAKIAIQNAFRSRIKSILDDNYGREDILGYLNKFKSEPKYEEIISDIYSVEMMKYSEAINFIDDEEARTGLWIITASLFSDVIEREKRTGKISAEVKVYNRGKNGNETVIEDETIASTKSRKKNLESKYSKYSLNRTIFEIADEDDNTDISIFDDKKSVEKEFFEGPFYNMLKEVMTSDRFCNMDNIKCKVLINPDTSWIPVIDFSNGYRLICIDTNDINQFRMHPLMISRKIKFTFSGLFTGSFRTRMVYSDNLIFSLDATVNALKKTIGFEYWNEKHIITLKHNYAIAYTTEPKYCDMFEYGDPDCKDTGNSTYNRTKPFTNVIGIVALDKKSVRNRDAARRNQIRQDLQQSGDKPDIDDYDINFVLSARYIVNDKALVDPTRAPDQRYVRYIITQYTECKPVIVMDGLQTICSCILKEHWIKYGKGTNFSIEFEHDRDNLPSPGIMDTIYAEDGVEPSTYKKVGDMNIQISYCLPPSRAKGDNVLRNERGRIDRRFFSAGTIRSAYGNARELFQAYDLGTNEGRIDFIRSRGFEEFWSPASATYDVMPYVLDQLASSSMIQSLHKISLGSLSDRESEDRENLLYEQDKLEFFKNLDNSSRGTFQKLLFSVLDWFLDSDGK